MWRQAKSWRANECRRATRSPVFGKTKAGAPDRECTQQCFLFGSGHGRGAVDGSVVENPRRWWLAIGWSRIPGGKIGLAGYKLSSEGAEMVWNQALEARRTQSTPVIFEGHVYFAGGENQMCVELASGKVKWQRSASARFLAAGRGRQIHCAGEKRQRPRDAQGLAGGA